MTITGTSTHHDVVVAWARHDIECVTGPNPWRERAERVLREWHSYEVMTGAEIADVLASYYPEEPVMVAGRDYLAEATADAAVIVAEVVMGTDWSRYGECPACGAHAGWVCTFVAISNRWGEPRTTPHEERPLVEVTDEPTAVCWCGLALVNDACPDYVHSPAGNEFRAGEQS